MNRDDASRINLPYIPLYPRDFLAATQGWTVAERGAYLMLLFAQWEQGQLPDDHIRLAAIAGVNAAEFRMIWKTVGRKFKHVGLGLVNARLEEHRRKSIELLEGRRKGALKTNAKRRGSNVIPFGQGGGT